MTGWYYLTYSFLTLLFSVNIFFLHHYPPSNFPSLSRSVKTERIVARCILQQRHSSQTRWIDRRSTLSDDCGDIPNFDALFASNTCFSTEARSNPRSRLQHGESYTVIFSLFSVAVFNLLEFSYAIRVSEISDGAYLFDDVLSQCTTKWCEPHH